MRTAGQILGGFVLLGAGITVIATDVPGRWVLGPALILVGLGLKVAGFLRDATPPPRGRTVTTLGTATRAAPVGAPSEAPPGQAARPTLPVDRARRRAS